jgi:hypothetical protein
MATGPSISACVGRGWRGGCRGGSCFVEGADDGGVPGAVRPLGGRHPACVARGGGRAGGYQERCCMGVPVGSGEM